MPTVESLPDSVPVSPDDAELAKREKMREGWRRDRAKKKTQVIQKSLTNK